MAEEEVKEQGNSKNKICFVIMPISDHPDYAPGHFKRVYEYIIKPACQKAGYEAIRADDTVKTNDIVSDIIKKIIDSDMAICDMSSRNPNVFYELGLRHAFNLKTTLIKDKKTSRAFDIAGLRSVEYDESLRVDEVNNAIETLVKAIKETEVMGTNEANSTIQLLGLSAPAKKVEIKAMSGENAAIMGEIRSLRDDMEVFMRYHVRERSYLQQIRDSRSRDEDSSIRYDISDEMRMRRGFMKPIVLNRDKDKEE